MRKTTLFYSLFLFFILTACNNKLIQREPPARPLHPAPYQVGLMVDVPELNLVKLKHEVEKDLTDHTFPILSIDEKKMVDNKVESYLIDTDFINMKGAIIPPKNCIFKMALKVTITKQQHDSRIVLKYSPALAGAGDEDYGREIKSRLQDDIHNYFIKWQKEYLTR